MTDNDWCQTLGIDKPDLAVVASHREASSYSLLIVALLERGEPMTLAEVARRFAAAGVCVEQRALAALQRCRPARAPVYRDGDRYSLDSHDAQADLWAFRLGLRPPKIAGLRVVRAEPPPSPGPDVPLEASELDEAWRDANLNNWSAQRLALAVLEVHGQPFSPATIVDFVGQRTEWHPLRREPFKHVHRGSPLEVLDDGRLAIAAHAGEALRAVRAAVRERVDKARRYAASRPDPVIVAARQQAAQRQREEQWAELAKLRRVLLAGFPAAAPRVVAMLDVGRHRIETFVDAEIEALRGRLADFDLLGAENVRGLLRGIGLGSAARRLTELGPPQKTRKLNRQGRTLKITTTLLVRGSCGISRPFGDPKKMAGYLEAGEHTRLRRRLEADLKSLYALYEYGRLHGAVRLRWGFLDEPIPAPWADPGGGMLYDLERRALTRGVALEVVVGTAPGWSEPWARARQVGVVGDGSGWRVSLVDKDGHEIDEAEVQRARLLE